MMNFPAFNLEFPALPSGLYQTAPIYLEPMRGSGERITVCAVAVGEGEAEAVGLINRDIAESLYGAQAGSFLGTVAHLTESLQAHCSRELPIEQWIPPLDGVYLGRVVTARADHARHAVAQVAQMHASLCNLPALLGTEEEECGILDASKDTTLSAWVKQVQDLTVSRNPSAARSINISIALAHGDTIRLHFAHEGRAACLGLLTPTKMTARVNDAKIKLWNLEHLPENFNRRELILGVPREDAPDMADVKTRTRLQERIRALTEESSRSGIDTFTAHTAEEAAFRLAA